MVQDQGLLNLCGHIFGGQFDKLLKEALEKGHTYHQNGHKFVEVPGIGGVALLEQMASYKPKACRAMLYQVGFDFEKPPGMRLRLPINTDAIERDKVSQRQDVRLVAYYAGSCAHNDWRLGHGSFHDYVAALAALGPECVGFDVTKVLPVYPREIPGINRKTLCCQTREEFEEKFERIERAMRASAGVPIETGFTPPKT
jgi:hypothetical protein